MCAKALWAIDPCRHGSMKGIRSLWPTTRTAHYPNGQFSGHYGPLQLVIMAHSSEALWHYTNKTYSSYQSYVFISFRLSYHKVIISHTLNKCVYSMQLRKNEFRKYQCVPSVPYNLLHWIPLNSSLLINSYQQNIYFISIICIYFIQSFIKSLLVIP